MVEAIMRRLGYVPRRQFESSVKKLGESRKRVDDLRSALEKARARREHAHRELADARAKLQNLTSECERRVAAVKAVWGDRYSKRCAALEAKLTSEAADQAEASRREWHEMEERVTAATGELGMAREYLMAVEVKLDILEGAANVLDRRLRAGRPARLEPGSPPAG